MKRRLVIAARFTTGAILGAAPGLALLGPSRNQGIGLGICGATIGSLLGIAHPVWGVSIGEALLNGGMEVLGGVAGNAIPGGDKPIPSGESDVPVDRDIPDELMEAVRSRTARGVKLGACLAVVPMIAAAFMFEAGQDPKLKVPGWLEPPLLALGVGLIAMMLFGMGGLMVAMMTVPGTHRRDALIGLAAGIFLGLGFAIAVTPDHGPEGLSPKWVTGCCGVFGFFGMLFGSISLQRLTTERK